MADVGAVGNAYLNVVPKMQGNPEQLGNSFGKSFSGGWKGAALAGAVAVGNILSDAAEKAASVLGEQMTKAFWNYADYEQLVGGVDTLFKESSQVVQDNAKQAFQTAGMSANEYMENVTSFSASLIQSLDGDTQKAAKVADQAIIDMSDNANKMGTDIDRITDAYQGFAKQNYTMLDNLKLGYGGTKTEMERLLQDAGKLANTEFNIDSYSDVIEAIHVIQENMDITGTTMEEGSKTISGSINQLQGAWDNFLTAVGDGGRTMDLSQVTDDLIMSIGAAADNIIPALGRIGETVFVELPPILTKAIGKAVEGLPEAFGSAIDGAFGGSDQGARIVRNIVEPFTQLGDSFSQLAETVSPFIDGAAPVLMTVLSGLAELASALIGAFALMLDGIVEAADGVINAAEDMWDGAGDAIDSLNKAVSDAWQGIKDSTSNAWNTIKAIPERAAQAIKSAVSGAMATIKSLVSSANQAVGGLKSIPNTVQGIFNKLKEAISKPIETAKKLVQDGMSAISNAVSGVHLRLPSIAMPHFWVSGGEFPYGIGGKGRMPEFGVNWYAKGGFADYPTLAGYGEKGTEFFWPGYEPYFDKYAKGIAKHLDGKGGVTVNATINGVENAEDAVEQLTVEIKRLKAAGVL